MGTGGSFTENSGTVLVSGDVTIISDGEAFNNLTVNSSGKKFYIQQATTLAGNLTITAGDVDTTGSNHALTVDKTCKINGGNHGDNFSGY